VKLESPQVESARSHGVGGIARVVAMLGVVVLAVVGILMVVEVVPVDVLGEFTGKLLGVGAIALLASVAIAVLAKR
jgi:hypothetical protein